jgi:uncharacterized protein YbaP (TraB family)
MNLGIVLTILFSFSINAFAMVTVPRLFKVRCADSKSDSYLLGTIHGDVSLDEFPVDVKSLIRNSRLVEEELNLSSADDALIREDFWKYVQKLLSQRPASVRHIDETTVSNLAAAGVPRYIAQQLDDSDCMILNTLAQARAKILLLDLQVSEVANQSHVPTQGLDTMELRDNAVNAQNLKCSLRNVFGKATPAQVDQGADGSLATQADAYRHDPNYLSGLDEPLATVRNKAWMPQIRADFADGGTFIAVGLAHLVGPGGLNRALEGQGCSVDPIVARPPTDESQPVEAVR